MNGFKGFNSLTHFLIRWSGLFFVILILILVVAWPVAVFFLMRRITIRTEPAAWSAIRIPVVISLLPVLACGHFWGRAFLAMDASIITGLFETVCVVLASSALFSAILWYKGLFIGKRVGSFVLRNCVMSIACIAILLVCSKGYEFLLFTDPGFRDFAAEAQKITQERAQNNLSV